MTYVRPVFLGDPQTIVSRYQPSRNEMGNKPFRLESTFVESRVNIYKININYFAKYPCKSRDSRRNLWPMMSCDYDKVVDA